MGRYDSENVTVAVIIQAVGGDLRLRGRPGRRLTVDGDGAHVEQIGENKPYVVRCPGDARVAVPEDVDVSVQQVGGDARLTDLGGALEVQHVGGDLTVRNVDSVQINAVGGDLRLKRATGDVQVEAVGSDATIREVEGDLHVKAVGSDLYVQGVEGNCRVERVGSDLVLSLDFLPDCEYRFSAGSDILCRVRPDANARFILPADTRVHLDVAGELSENAGGQQIVTLGEGRATIQIGAAATLRLIGEEDEYLIDFGAQLGEELEARLSSLEERLDQQLAGLDERLQFRTDKLAAQAEKLAQRAQREAERAVENLRFNMERRAKRKREPGPRRAVFRMDGMPAPPRRSEPVTEQERLMILQMVQDKKITIEEAERLLAALDS